LDGKISREFPRCLSETRSEIGKDEVEVGGQKVDAGGKKLDLFDEFVLKKILTE